ncbi:DUF3810 domain-containing protein [Candidatus Gracilibacteria bacterium]|nr:DUF3810 domain-containing protein [Candidatus Gracilibacteria bacterium]
MNNYIVNKVLSTFLIIQMLFIVLISRHPEWVEKYYSNGLYPFISRLLRKLLGWIPISVGDLLYLLFVFIVLKWLWYLFQTRLYPLLEHIYALGAFISIVFFVFHLFWGLNYYRLPFYERLDLNSLEFTQEELLQTTQNHIDKLNNIHHLIEENDSVAIVVPYKRTAIFRMASAHYKNLKIDSVALHFKTRSIKGSLMSKPLSYMGFSGYLNPFTGEAQVNREIPKSNFPATTCHEMAHQLGYASEDEANYIGYLACITSEDAFFRYSGELLAVQHLLYAIVQHDKELYREYYDKLHVGIQRNIQQNRDFWDSYQNPFEPYFKKFYDLFLKANSQKEGIDSYNAMVGYLVKNEH